MLFVFSLTLLLVAFPTIAVDEFYSQTRKAKRGFYSSLGSASSSVMPKMYLAAFSARLLAQTII